MKLFADADCRPPFGEKVPGRKWQIACSLLLLAGLIFILAGPALSPDRTWYSADGPLVMGPWNQYEQWQGYRSANPDLGDQDFLYYPYLHFMGREISGRGELPLWNPHLFGGVPLAGNAQFPLLYPGHLPLWLSQVGAEEFDQPAFSRAFLWHALIRLLFCAFGAWFWFRRLGAGLLPAFMGGVGLGISGYMVVWLQFTPGQVFCFIPPALFFLEGYLQRRSWVDLFFYSLFFACSNLGGYPQTSFFLGGFLLVYALARIGLKPGMLLPYLGASIAGGLLAMPSFLPFLEYLGLSAIKAMRKVENVWPVDCSGWQLSAVFFGGLLLLMGAVLVGRQRWRFGWVATGVLGAIGVLCLDNPAYGADGQVLHFLLPLAWGQPMLDTWVGTGHPNFVEVNADYLGSALILLMLFAPLVRPRGGHRLVLVLMAIAFGAWLYSAKVPLLHQCGRELLFIAHATRSSVVLPLVFSGLAVYALHRIMKLSLVERRNLVRPMGAVLVGIAVALIAGVCGLWGEHAPLWALRDVVFLLLSIAGLFWLLNAARTWFPALGICLVVALDLLTFGYGFNPATPLADVYPETPMFTWLQERDREARQQGKPFRVLGDRMMMRPNICTVFGLSDVRGHDCFDPESYMFTFASLCKPGTMPQDVGHQTLQMQWRAFELLGVKYYCTADEWEPLAGWKLAYTNKKVRVYEHENSLPRAFLVPENAYIHLGVDKTFMNPDWDPRKTVFLEQQGEKLPGPAFSTGDALMVTDTPNRIEVETAADGWSWLVLMDNYYPGWQARLASGSKLEIKRAYGFWRCVAVPPGKQKVVFSYQPASWRWGLWLALTGGVLLVLVVVGVGVSGRRRSRN